MRYYRFLKLFIRLCYSKMDYGDGSPIICVRPIDAYSVAKLIWLNK